MDILLFILCLLTSGSADGIFFVYASQMWGPKGNLIMKAFVLSTLGGTIGITMYWMYIRFLGRFRVVPVLVQSLGWTVVSIVAQALLDKSWLKWTAFDKGVLGLAIIAVCWLLYHAGH